MLLRSVVWIVLLITALEGGFAEHVMGQAPAPTATEPELPGDPPPAIPAALLKDTAMITQGEKLWHDQCTHCHGARVTASDTGPQSPERRVWLTGALASGVTLWSPLPTLADDPRMARPQEGDAFVFATGDRAGTPISETDLALGGPPVLAWPMDPATKTVRDGSRLNQVLLLRLDVSGFDETTRARAAEGGFVGHCACCRTAL